MRSGWVINRRGWVLTATFVLVLLAAAGSFLWPVREG